MAAPEQHPSIDHKIDGDDQRAENVLQALVEPGRINDRDQIVLDEAAGVTRLARGQAQFLFQRRQRTDAVAKLDGRRPQDGRQVQAGRPFLAQQQKAAEDDEQDEAEMQQDNAVGKDSLDHGNSGP